jgi:SAM-dependent methyltransferase
VGFYAEQVVPRLQEKVMGRSATGETRARVCADLRGDVVEIGFGTGLNLPHYPAGVTRVLAVEPSALCMKIAAPRIAQASVRVEMAGLTGERLKLESGQFDAVLSTWALCTIPDPAAALAEIHRVLKPGGTFHFVEHGLAPDADVARWQRRIEPVNKRLAGGCHPTRRIAGLIGASGLSVGPLSTYYFAGTPKSFGYTFEGRATKSL